MVFKFNSIQISSLDWSRILFLARLVSRSLSTSCYFFLTLQPCFCCRERHPGSFDIVHVKDANGHVFATRLGYIFIIGTSTLLALSLIRCSFTSAASRGTCILIAFHTKLDIRKCKGGIQIFFVFYLCSVLSLQDFRSRLVFKLLSVIALKFCNW